MVRSLRQAAGTLLLLVAACAPNRGEGFEKNMADARTAYGAGRFDVAAQRFDDAAKGAKIKRDGDYARYEAALARERAGDAARAGADLRHLAAENGDYADQAAYKAADLAFRADPEAGYRELAAMMERFPDSALAKVALQRLLHRDDDAAGLARLDALAPRISGKALEEDVQYERAKRLASLGRNAEAHDAFVVVADRWPYPKGPYFDDALFRAAEVEEKQGHPQEAIALLERLLKFREMSVTIGSYERPRYIPALLKIAALYEDALHDRAKARDAYHRLYTEFKTSTLRDDALWREADLWQKDGDTSTACDRLSTLASDFPDSRYVPCAIDRCSTIKREAKSKAPKTCHAYLTRDPSRKQGEDVAPTVDTTRPDDPKGGQPR